MHVHVEIQMNCLTSISNIDTGPEVHGNAGRRTQVESVQVQNKSGLILFQC